MHARRLRLLAAAAVLATAGLGVNRCSPFGFGSPLLFFRAPLFAQLSQTEGIAVELVLSRLADPASLEIQLDGTALDTSRFQPGAGGALVSTLDPLSPG